MAPAITAVGLCKTFQVSVKEPGLRGSIKAVFRPSRRAVDAVRDLSFTAARGEILACIGPNGAGKSTTIKMLTGILFPTAGEAVVLGLVPWRDRARLNRRIATVFGQRSQLWYHLPPADTFELLGRIYEIPGPECRARVRLLVEEFGLGAAFCSNFLGLSRLVSEGQLDYFLAAPQDPFLHLLVARGWFAGWGDIAFGVGAFLLAGRGTAWRFAVFPAVVLCGAAVLVSFGFIYGSLAFFWGRSEAISGMALESLLIFSLWPGEIFPAALRLLFFTLIPAGLVSHLPVRLLARFEWPLFLALLAAAAGSVLLAGFVFRAVCGGTNPGTWWRCGIEAK
ncbi:MAG: ABC-2 family transporter protein [Firmicutes bacterium]|nr:ABC-2 family transporter protein [Bacillota bacterium]